MFVVQHRPSSLDQRKRGLQHSRSQRSLAHHQPGEDYQLLWTRAPHYPPTRSPLASPAQVCDVLLPNVASLVLQTVDASSTGRDMVSVAYRLSDKSRSTLIGATRDSSNPPWGWSWVDDTSLSNLNCMCVGKLACCVVFSKSPCRVFLFTFRIDASVAGSLCALGNVTSCGLWGVPEPTYVRIELFLRILS